MLTKDQINETLDKIEYMSVTYKATLGKDTWAIIRQSLLEYHIVMEMQTRLRKQLAVAACSTDELERRVAELEHDLIKLSKTENSP